MAANTVGHPQTDHLRTMGLVEAALDFAGDVLRPGGAFVAKVLAGGADNNLVAAAQAPLHHRQARQAPRQPQGLQRMVCRGAGVQGLKEPKR
jgi:23S rRNA (uridine2552-2'-O)-methyltransferase